MATKIFVNLPVKNLNKSVEFFTKLGFRFNPQFTDETATPDGTCELQIPKDRYDHLPRACARGQSSFRATQSHRLKRCVESRVTH